MPGPSTNEPGIRVAGIDEWAWRKGTKFGTIVVDLERRRVVDLLADRRADRTADWLRQHPEVEIINRDRDGLHADAARQGAPQAHQVADRFQLLKNLRETIGRHLGGFEAPIRTSATEIEDDRDARSNQLSTDQVGIRRPWSGNGSGAMP